MVGPAHPGRRGSVEALMLRSHGAVGGWGRGRLLRLRPRRARFSVSAAACFEDASQIIGATPLVRLRRLCDKMGVEGQILAKCEQFNPGFSKKDRICKQILEDAEAEGELRAGQHVVELTSGNTGTGLAIVCAVRGYKFVAVMSRGNSMERARMMEALGAEVVLVDQQDGSVPGQVSGADLELVEEATQKIVAERGAFRADQFNHRGNFRAHYLHTGCDKP
jgi:cysteine synthase A